jgi:hypothetical protein
MGHTSPRKDGFVSVGLKGSPPPPPPPPPPEPLTSSLQPLPLPTLEPSHVRRFDASSASSSALSPPQVGPQPPLMSAEQDIVVNRNNHHQQQTNPHHLTVNNTNNNEDVVMVDDEGVDEDQSYYPLLDPLPATPGWLRIVSQQGAKLRPAVSMDNQHPEIATLPCMATYRFTAATYCFPPKDHRDKLIPVVRLFVTLDSKNNNHNSHVNHMSGSVSGWLSLSGRSVCVCCLLYIISIDCGYYI